MIEISPAVIAIATIAGTVIGTAVSVVILRVLHDASTLALEAKLFAYLAAVFQDAGLPVPTLPPNVGVVLVRRENPLAPVAEIDKQPAPNIAPNIPDTTKEG
jgi:hypothetical protein